MHFHSSMTRTSGYDTGGCPPVHITFHSSSWLSSGYDAVGNSAVHITFHSSSSNSNFVIPHLILMPLSSSPSCRRPVPLQEVRLHTASRPKITKPCPTSSPPTRTDCSTSSSCACWRIFTRAQASGCMMPPPLQVMRSRMCDSKG